MPSDVMDPPADDPDNLVTLTFEISFTKCVDLVSPENTLHEMRVQCMPRHHKAIKLGPFGPHDKFVAKDGKLREWAENRALLSVATGFLDAEFARAVYNADPPPPELAARRKPHPGC